MVGCPIQRPPVPQEYFYFRADLQGAVTDSAVSVMAGKEAMQARLDERITELSALLLVDSLVAILYADDRLSRLGGAVDATVKEQLQADGVGKDVRQAYLNEQGQRLAVDAIVVGLGRALYLSRN